MKARPVITFFLLALTLSWLGWIPYAAVQAGRLHWRMPAEWIWLAEYGPTVAALVMVGSEGGRVALGRFLRRCVQWRVPVRWYLVALLMTPAIASATAAGWSLTGSALDWSALAGWDARFIARTAAFSPSAGLIDGLVAFMHRGPWATALVFVALAIANGGLSEELGWRGYAQGRLERGRSALLASVLVAVLWALWHTGTGFWLVVFTQSAVDTARFALGYLGQYLVLVIPLAVIYTAVVNGARGSLLPAILLHASYNMTITVVTSAWPAFPLPAMVAVLWLVAAFAVWHLGAARLGKNREEAA